MEHIDLYEFLYRSNTWFPGLDNVLWLHETLSRGGCGGKGLLQ